MKIKLNFKNKYLILLLAKFFKIIDEFLQYCNGFYTLYNKTKNL